MERGVQLARLSVWLCLLGGGLALGAFFLPYYTPPPASRIPHGSLWQVLVLMVFQQEYPQGSFSALSAGGLLLLVVSILVLAVFALVLRSPRWTNRALYLRLSTFTFLFYVFAAMADLFFYWFGTTLASASPTDDPLLDTLRLVGIGAWLMLAGLLLTLVGGVLRVGGPSRALEILLPV